METADIDMFEQKLTKVPIGNKAMLLNDYLSYLTSGQIQNPLIFNFAKTLRRKVNKDIISTFNLKNVLLMDHVASNIIERVKT